ncbi:MAG: antitoxin, partial [Acidimicrobiales bacterium]
MSTRLQVVVDEDELTSYQRAARQHGLTLSEWVRQNLRNAEREVASGDVASKLAAVRAAATHEFPTGDIEVVLAEIERGYLDDVD